MNKLQESNKLVDDAVHKMRQLMKKWDDRLTLDNLRISERYVKGAIDLFIHIKVRSADPCDSGYFCAVLGHHDPAGGKIINHTRHVLKELSEFRGDFEQLRKVGTTVGTPEPDPSKPENEQEAVFVEIVKLMESPKVIVPTLVRLDSIDSVYSCRAHSLYHSRRVGFVFGQRFADGKIRPLGNLPVRFRSEERRVGKECRL